jgi:hypothetical protein
MVDFVCLLSYLNRIGLRPRRPALQFLAQRHARRAASALRQNKDQHTVPTRFPFHCFGRASQGTYAVQGAGKGRGEGMLGQVLFSKDVKVGRRSV